MQLVIEMDEKRNHWPYLDKNIKKRKHEKEIKQWENSVVTFYLSENKI